MNHDYVEQNEVVDLYLMGRLDPADSAAFEEHYLSCASCLRQLELAESFQAGLKRVAAEDAVKVAVVRRAGLLASLARAARSPRAGLLAAAVLVAVLTPSVLIHRQLAAERDRAVALEAELEAARAPRGALYLTLSPERGGAGGEPAARFALPALPGPVVLSLELERPDLATYRVAVIDPQGVTLWRSGALEPNHLDALTLNLGSSFLRPGDYELRVEGLPPDGAPRPVGRFAFRVLPAE